MVTTRERAGGRHFRALDELEQGRPVEDTGILADLTAWGYAVQAGMAQTITARGIEALRTWKEMKVPE